MVISAGRQLYEDILLTCRLSINRIEQTKELNSFITVLTDSALKAASQSDARHKSNSRISNIDGWTIAIKDNFCTEGVRTTCASKMLENFISPYESTVTKRLKNAGTIIVGKTNLDEFAMGSGTVDSLFGPTKNIYGSPFQSNLTNSSDSLLNFENWRISGGSSGGSAVAVASGCTFAAIGSDTGGSTRNPASYCGIVGFKPTYGVVSRYGLIPLVNSMDVPGIMARNVEDVTNIFNVISGRDDLDSTTIDESLPLVNISEEIDIKTIRIGIPDEYYHDMLSSEVTETWEAVIKVFENAGATVKRISMPHTASSIVTYSILNSCDVASNMSRYTGIIYGHRADTNISTDQLISDTRKEGFGPVVRTRILAGNYFLLKENYEKYFIKATKVRRLISDDFSKAWSSGIDILLTPTTLTTAPLLSEFMKKDNRAQSSIQDYCTQSANMAGCPAISLPIRLSNEKLPISLQLMGNNFNDSLLLKIAKWLQDTVEFPQLQN